MTWSTRSERKEGGETTGERDNVFVFFLSAGMDSSMKTMGCAITLHSWGVASNCCCRLGSPTCTLGTTRKDGDGKHSAHAEDEVIDAVGCGVLHCQLWMEQCVKICMFLSASVKRCH